MLAFRCSPRDAVHSNFFPRTADARRRNTPTPAAGIIADGARAAGWAVRANRFPAISFDFVRTPSSPIRCMKALAAITQFAFERYARWRWRSRRWRRCSARSLGIALRQLRRLWQRRVETPLDVIP